MFFFEPNWFFDITVFLSIFFQVSRITELAEKFAPNQPWFFFFFLCFNNNIIFHAQVYSNDVASFRVRWRISST